MASTLAAFIDEGKGAGIGILYNGGGALGAYMYSYIVL